MEAATIPDRPSQLENARRIVATNPFDTEAALILLNDLRWQERDVQVRGAVRHALRCVVATVNDASVVGVVNARFAMARVVALLGQLGGQ